MWQQALHTTCCLLFDIFNMCPKADFISVCVGVRVYVSMSVCELVFLSLLSVDVCVDF